MKKTEKYITAVLFIVFGVAFIVLKTSFIGIITTVFGVGLITLGIIDVIQGSFPPAVLKLLFGLVVTACGWALVEAVFYVAAACLLALGAYGFYKKWQENDCDYSLPALIQSYALPSIAVAVGLLLLLHQTALMNVIFVVCGILIVLAGVILLIFAFQDEE